MCGIVGAVAGRPVDARVIERMRDRLAHRGPDAAGLWTRDDRRVCLGHRRLAVVDPTPGANQPFVSEDGRYVITLNGEIYNFRALRRTLEEAGVVFRTRSDTEVLLACYRHFGERCLEQLSGMFAFAIWDESQRRLFCARDRAGEKPFHYAVVGDSFVFASELKSLLLWPGFERELDGTALVDFLSFGYVPDPKTVWSGARKLPPGHHLTVELGRDRPRVGPPNRYWDLRFDPDETVKDWTPLLRETLTEASREMSYADVPVGTFLSGGVDSSSVAAALTRAGAEVRTYTIGFEEAAFDERPFARQVATSLGSRHTERTVRADDVEDVFRQTILWHYDEPFADYSYIPTYYVCREARNSITVALTGDGGDELFAGYGKYSLLARRSRLESALSRPVTQFAATAARSVSPRLERLRPYEQSAEELLCWMLTTGTSPGALRNAARGPLARALDGYDPADAVRPHLERVPPDDAGLVNAMRYLDLKLTLAAGILTKVDRAAMSVSLETRPVLLNRGLLDLAGRIPPWQLADGAGTKKVLRHTVPDWLPPEVASRPKMGFAMPLGNWFQHDLRPLAAQAGSGPLAELIDPSYTSSVMHEHLSGHAERTAELHNLVFLNNWLEAWL